MTRSPHQLPGIVGGVLAGLVMAWLSLIAVSYASGHLLLLLVRYRTDRGDLAWSVVIIVVALVLGLLMSIRPIAAGAMIGAGLFWSGVSLALQVLPIQQAVDLSKLFEVPGKPAMRSSVIWDGSILFLGALVLALGAGRLVNDARQRPQPRPQDTFPPLPGNYQDTPPTEVSRG